MGPFPHFSKQLLNLNSISLWISDYKRMLNAPQVDSEQRAIPKTATKRGVISRTAGWYRCVLTLGDGSGRR